MMDVINDRLDSHRTRDSLDNNTRNKYNEICEISSNWQINNGKQFNDTISITHLSKTSNKSVLEETVSVDTCIELCNTSKLENDPCLFEIKIKNGQRINNIAVVSEATVLEFFKQSGEYAATVFAEFVDEFENNSVYMGTMAFDPPTSEANIKFTKVKNKSSLMWLYGIRLTLTDPVSKEETQMFNPQIINDFLLSFNNSKSKSVEMANKVLQSFNSEQSNGPNEDIDYFAKFIGMGLMSPKQGIIKSNKEKQKTEASSVEQIADPTQNNIDLRTYIDDKFIEMEKRIMNRIDQMEQKTNQKLDKIMNMLDTKIKLS